MNISFDKDELFELWKNHPPTGKDLLAHLKNHLSNEDLIRFAKPGGLALADAEKRHHLSRCPVCLQEWAAWAEFYEEYGEVSEEWMVFEPEGLLVAEDEGKSITIDLPHIRLLIDIIDEDLDLGEILLVVRDKSLPVGTPVFVRDKNRILLEGALPADRRLSAPLKNFSSIVPADMVVHIKAHKE